jgi:hypothetical protein
VDSPASHWISVPSGTQVPGRSRSAFTYGTVTLFGWLSHTILLTERFVTPMCQALQPRSGKPDRFGLFPVRSPLLGELFLFLWVLRCFSSPGSLLPIYRFNWEMPLVRNGRFPYSEIPGSAPVHGSPRLIAVSHVLHRHLTPRHPP